MDVQLRQCSKAGFTFFAHPVHHVPSSARHRRESVTIEWEDQLRREAGRLAFLPPTFHTTCVPKLSQLHVGRRVTWDNVSSEQLVDRVRPCRIYKPLRYCVNPARPD